MKSKCQKILHCPHLVGGQSSAVAQFQRALGANSTAVAWEASPFGYCVDEVLWPENAGLFMQELLRLKLLFRAVGNFDVIHYNYGSSMLNWGALDGRHRGIALGLGGAYAALNARFELPFVKAMGKIIAVTYQGDDARQGGYCRENFAINIANEVGEEYYSDSSDRAKQARIATFAKHADLIYALNPDLMHVLPATSKFMPYAHVDIDDWQPSYRQDNTIPLVVHAPSNRQVKGTKFLVSAVERLRAEGLEFDFQMVEGMAQSAAKKLYEKADIVVDQLLAGWYGGFAVEVMALGKPVICYLRHQDLGFLPQGMREELPLIEAQPETIENVLRDWILRPRWQLQEQGMKARKFVEAWHDPKKVATQLLDDYADILLQRNG